MTVKFLFTSGVFAPKWNALIQNNDGAHVPFPNDIYIRIHLYLPNVSIKFIRAVCTALYHQSAIGRVTQSKWEKCGWRPPALSFYADAQKNKQIAQTKCCGITNDRTNNDFALSHQKYIYRRRERFWKSIKECMRWSSNTAGRKIK